MQAIAINVWRDNGLDKAKNDKLEIFLKIIRHFILKGVDIFGVA